MKRVATIIVILYRSQHDTPASFINWIQSCRLVLIMYLKVTSLNSLWNVFNNKKRHNDNHNLLLLFLIIMSARPVHIHFRGNAIQTTCIFFHTFAHQHNKILFPLCSYYPVIHRQHSSATHATQIIRTIQIMLYTFRLSFCTRRFLYKV